MRRSLSKITFFISLLLPLVAVAMWVRSYYNQDNLVWYPSHSDRASRFGTYRTIWSFEGEVSILIMPIRFEDWMEMAGISFVSSPAGPETYNNDARWIAADTYLGYESEWHHVLGMQFSRTVGRYPARYGIVIPYWIATFMATVPTLYFFARWLRRWRRPTPGACPNCGYDLRASPDRCPECGKRR
jgi:hypothetical protein